MLESAMLKIEYDKPLAALTTFHLRANAEAWVEVASLEDIRDALSVAKGRGWQTTILGGGSNVVPMPLVPGLVIHPVFRGIHEAQSESGSLVVVAGAAEALDDLVRYTVGKELGGLENLAAIPGSVGGAVVQNAGAYGVEMAERIAWVRVYDPDIDDFRDPDADRMRFWLSHEHLQVQGRVSPHHYRGGLCASSGLAAGDGL